MHNVHLIRSNEVNKRLFSDVLELLQAHQGPFRFNSMEDPYTIEQEQIDIREIDEDSFFKKDPNPKSIGEFNKKILRESNYSSSKIPPPKLSMTINWAVFQSACFQYRRKFGIGENDIIFFLTDRDNSYNWFSAIIPETKNGFVQTSNWESYIIGDPKYAISYSIMSHSLFGVQFKNNDELLANVHHRSKGCPLDLCEDKREIELKLRTGDFCTNCARRYNTLELKKEVNQLKRLMGTVQRELKNANRIIDIVEISTIIISTSTKIIRFFDYKINLRLSPLEFTIYKFFLAHPEGVRMVDLSDYYQEIYDIYSKVSNQSEPDRIEKTALRLARNTDESTSQVISRTKAKLRRVVKDPALLDYYIIKGCDGEAKGIRLDRSFVSYT